MADRRDLLTDVLLPLHDALLPRGLPVPQGVEIAARYLLAEDYAGAGGDWFDAVPLPDGSVVVVVGDVVGHGVEASVTMGELRAVFDERVRADGDVLAALGVLEARARRVRGARAATLCAAVVDPATGAVTYCTAGHPPPVVVTAAGEASYLPATGSGPLGSGLPFRTATHRLDRGDVLVLYSNGLVRRPARTPGESTVDLLRATADVVGRTADRVCRQVLERMVRSVGHSDDISLLALQVVPPIEPLELHLAALPDAVRTVRADLDAWWAGLHLADLDRAVVQHAVGELVTNVVEHAYDEVDVRNPLDVDVRISRDGHLDLSVADRGAWREPADDAEVGGRGLAMAAGLLDEFALERSPTGTCARGRHLLTRPAALLMSTETHPVVDRAAPYHLEVEGGTLLVAGGVDAGSAEDLRIAVAQVSLGGTRPVTVDLSAVDLLGSAAVQALYDACAAGPVDVVAPMGSPAQHVLDVVRLPYRG